MGSFLKRFRHFSNLKTGMDALALEISSALLDYASPCSRHVRNAIVSHKGTLRIAPAWIILP